VERGRLDDGTDWGVIAGGDAMLCIYQHPERRTVDGDALQRERIHGINHFGLRITERAAWERVIEEQGVEVRYGGPVQWPHATAWYVLDPTGHEIEVVLWNGDRIAFD
jgi:catechol 2,3-dioxygenase-like lactoylglutathione lyase family enzyme